MNMWKTNINIFTYKNINGYLVRKLIFNRLKTLNRKDLLGGPPTWVESLCPAFGRRCFWPERLLVGELYPSRMILEHDGLKWLKHQSDPNISQSWRGGLALWANEKNHGISMGFSMVFSSFRLVSDHVNVNVITYQNWILRKRLGDITEFYGEGPRVPRVF